MRFYVEQAPKGSWRVMLRGADAPVSEHDTEEEAQERVGAYLRGLAAASAPTMETGIARGDRVRLRDGAEVVVRQLTPDDKPLLLEAFGAFGEVSRYQRFMAPKKRLSAKELAYFTDIDHTDHEAIGALDPQTGRGAGVARFIRERPGGPVAEAAVAVVDAWQGRGLGGVLLERLARRATEVGVTEFSASLLTDNRAMLALFARLGRIDVRHDQGSTARLNVCLDVAGGEGLQAALRAAAAGEVAS
jgi:GNAT superfamily N-acetyltransferase